MVLYTFGDDVHAQKLTQCDDGLHDGAGAVGLGDFAHERAVDLQ